MTRRIYCVVRHTTDEGLGTTEVAYLRNCVQKILLDWTARLNAAKTDENIRRFDVYKKSTTSKQMAEVLVHGKVHTNIHSKYMRKSTNTRAINTQSKYMHCIQ